MTDSIEVAKLFLKLGAIGFGGPAATIAMMEDEVVNRRQWLERSHFLDLVGATNLIPGPNSTEIAIHIGYIRAGWLGLIVAGVCFILPAVLITGGFGWVYVTFGTLPQVAPFFYGIKPAVLAVIFNAVWRLGKTAVKNRKLFIIGCAVSLTLFLGLNEIAALFLGGLLGMIWLHFSDKNNNVGTGFGILNVGFLISTLSPSHSSAISPPPPLWQLGLFFLKIGSVLFGSGYVLVAFLQGELVNEYGWLTQQQLLDAIAIGQFTPGPLLSTATFIGYIISGLPGAIVATVAIFLPSFVFVAALNPLIPRLRASKRTAAFLDAINVSSIALMAVVTIKLAATTLTDWLSILIALFAAFLAICFRLNAAWLVLIGAVIGWLANFYQLR